MTIAFDTILVTIQSGGFTLEQLSRLRYAMETRWEDAKRKALPPPPTYNHTRADGECDPCDECKARASARFKASTEIAALEIRSWPEWKQQFAGAPPPNEKPKQKKYQCTARGCKTWTTLTLPSDHNVARCRKCLGALAKKRRPVEPRDYLTADFHCNRCEGKRRCRACLRDMRDGGKQKRYRVSSQPPCSLHGDVWCTCNSRPFK